MGDKFGYQIGFLKWDEIKKRGKWWRWWGCTGSVCDVLVVWNDMQRRVKGAKWESVFFPWNVPHPTISFFFSPYFFFSSFLSLSLSCSVALSFLFVAHPITFSPPPFHVFCDSSLFLIHWGRGPFVGSSQGFLFFIFDASTGVLQLSVTAESRRWVFNLLGILYVNPLWKDLDPAGIFWIRGPLALCALFWFHSEWSTT